MKKLLIIAFLAIITSPSIAKTKVFGEIHASYDNVFAVGAKSRNTFSVNNSFLGIKGSTEIKKDISFVYQLAWGLDSNDFEGNDFNSTDLSGIDNRNQVIGLASPVGAVVVGRFDTPFKKVGQKADLFWHSQLGQNRNITNGQTWDLRADKIIAFQTPRKKGFQASLAYASDISDTSRVTANASAVSINGFYKKGKFLFGGAYEQHDLEDSSANTNALRLSATYKDGPLKLVGFFQSEDNDTTVTSESDATVFGVGIAYRKGKGTYKGQFYQRDIDSSGGNPNLVAIGYDYRFSGKLDVYTQAALITNADSLIDNLSTTSSDVHGISFGLRYKF